jgi:hypothetical protein
LANVVCCCPLVPPLSGSGSKVFIIGGTSEAASFFLSLCGRWNAWWNLRRKRNIVPRFSKRLEVDVTSNEWSLVHGGIKPPVQPCSELDNKLSSSGRVWCFSLWFGSVLLLWRLSSSCFETLPFGGVCNDDRSLLPKVKLVMKLAGKE